MNTKELRKLAEALQHNYLWYSVDDINDDEIDPDDAAYIAAASPTAIIEILDRVDAVEKMLKSEQEYGIYWRERAEELKEQTP